MERAPLLAPRDAARRLNSAPLGWFNLTERGSSLRFATPPGDLSTSRLVQLDREGKFPALRDSAGRRLYEAAAVEAYAEIREGQRRHA